MRENAPMVYVSTYAIYNDASLFGEWWNLWDFADYEEFEEAVKEYLAERDRLALGVSKEDYNIEDHMELMFQDWENCGGSCQYGFMKEQKALIWDFGLNCKKEEWNAVIEYLSVCDSIEECSPNEILDKLVFCGSFKDYAAEIADEMLNQCGDEIIMRYFDYEAWQRDLAFDNYVITDNYIFMG